LYVNVKLLWLVSRLDTCVSAVSQVSNIFTMSQSRLVSTKYEMSRLVSCLNTYVLANVSVSEQMTGLDHWDRYKRRTEPHGLQMSDFFRPDALPVSQITASKQ